jgi:hypothetical protein
MRPRINVVLTPEDQRTYAIWSRGVVTAVVLLAVAVVAVPLLSRAVMAPVSVAAAQAPWAVYAKCGISGRSALALPMMHGFGRRIVPAAIMKLWSS